MLNTCQDIKEKGDDDDDEKCEKQVRPVRWPSTGSNRDQNWCGKIFEHITQMDLHKTK